MHEALSHIESWNGHQVYLQVESDNRPAAALYDSLAFDQLGVVRRWQGAISTLRLTAPNALSGLHTRSMRRNEWRVARELDRAAFSPDLNWPAPPPADYYKTGIVKRVGDLLSGRRQETWVVEDPADRNRSFGGLIDIVSEWGRPHQLRLCVAPDWQHSLTEATLYAAIGRLQRLRGGRVWLNHPVADASIESLFTSSNFRLRRSLAVMRKNLSRNRSTTD
jgi:hypothetical protein